MNLLPGFLNVYIPTLILRCLFLGWVLGGHHRDLFQGGKGRWPGRLMFMNFKSVEMPSFLQPTWDAVQKRPNRADLRQLSLEISASKVGPWLTSENLGFGRGPTR